MDDFDKSCDKNILSQSYIEGVKRVAGKCRDDEEDFYLSQEVIDSRKRTWSSFFDKFSQVTDDVELNITTLRPDSESSDSHHSEYRVPVRKSEAQVRYWVNTGNPPCQLYEEEAKAKETDETISISETEASEPESFFSTSMVANNKQATSTDQLVNEDSSESSVDTATYIKTNTNTMKVDGSSVEKDPRATNFANLENNRVSRSNNAKIPYVSLSRSMESPKSTENLKDNSILHKSASAISVMDAECNRDDYGRSVKDLCGKGDKVDKTLHPEQSESNDLRESEVTLDSKESGIGSLAITKVNENKKTEEIISSDSQNDIIPLPKIVQPRMRKLYTENDSFFDLVAPLTQTVSRNRSSRYSIHPALNSDLSSGKKTQKFRPSLLTLPGNSRARKSRLYSSKMTKSKLGRKSLLSVTRELKNSKESSGKDISQIKEAHTAVAEKINNPGPEGKVSANIGKTSKTTIFSTQEKKMSKISSPDKSSSSLSSDDVSKIINEKTDTAPRPSVVNSAKKKTTESSDIAKIQSPRDRDCRNNFIEPILEDSDGSVFSPGENASLDKTETRMKNVLLTKKNLFVTDLRSLDSNSSCSALSPSGDDGVDKASPTSVFDFRKKSEGASPRSLERLKKTKTDIGGKISSFGRSNPVVVLHDFRSLKNCCEQSDKEACEEWIAKKNAIDERLDKKALSMKKTLESFYGRIPSTRKSKVENEAASLMSEGKILPPVIMRNDFCSSDEFSPYLKYDRPAVDPRVTNSDDNQKKKSANGSNVMVTFPTRNCEKELIFVLESSDDENFLNKLFTKSRSRSSKRKSKTESADKNIANPDEKNKSVKDSCASQDSKFSSTKYEIVFSSSENEETTIKKHSHPIESRKHRRKFSKRNEGKDSPDSGLMMYSTQDGCSDKSAGMQHRDEKLEKQSPDINKRLETSKGKQRADLRMDFLAAQSDEVNNGPRSRRKPRTKVRKEKEEEEEDNDFERVFSDKRESDKTRKNSEVENREQERIFERLKTPVDGGSNCLTKRGKGVSTKKTTGNDSEEINSTEDRSRKDVKSTKKSRESPKKKRRKSTRKIITESSESDEELEIQPAPDYKREKKTPLKDVGIKALIDDDRLRIFDDESSDTNDAMIFSSQNNAGSYSRIIAENNDDTSSTINSYKHPVSPTFTKRGTTVKNNNVDNNYSKDKSTIIFQTKEYWESDSDNS